MGLPVLIQIVLGVSTLTIRGVGQINLIVGQVGSIVSIFWRVGKQIIEVLIELLMQLLMEPPLHTKCAALYNMN